MMIDPATVPTITGKDFSTGIETLSTVIMGEGISTDLITRGDHHFK